MSSDYDSGRDEVNAGLGATDFARAPLVQPTGYACTEANAADTQWWESDRGTGEGTSTWEPISDEPRPEAEWARPPGGAKPIPRFGQGTYLASIAAAEDLTAGKVPWWEGAPRQGRPSSSAIAEAPQPMPVVGDDGAGQRQSRFGAARGIGLGATSARTRLMAASCAGTMRGPEHVDMLNAPVEHAGESAEWRSFAPLLSELKGGQNTDGADAKAIDWGMLDKMLAMLDIAASMP